jgi:ATP-dependent DNA helicase RecQ
MKGKTTCGRPPRNERRCPWRSCRPAAGKSLCFQLPRADAGGRDGGDVVAADRADARPGPALRARASAAGALTSAIRRRRPSRSGALEDGALKLLYMAPERSPPPGRTGCCARRRQPDRRGRGALRQPVGPRFPPRLPADRRAARARCDVPLAAFTATADAETRDEIVARCSMADARDLPARLRPAQPPPRLQPKDQPRQQILELRRRAAGQSGIVYCGTRAKTETLAQALRERGTPPAPITAGWRPRPAGASSTALPPRTG